MGFFSKRRIRKAAAAVVAKAQQPGDDGLAAGIIDVAPIERLAEGERADAWIEVADELFDVVDDEEPALADAVREAVRRAMELEPECWEALSTLAQLEQHLERGAAAIDAYRRLLALDGSANPVRVELACLLLAGDDGDEVDEGREVAQGITQVQDPHDGLRLGVALFGAGCLDEALALLEPLRTRCYEALSQATFVDSGSDLADLYEQVTRLRDAVYAELHGQDGAVVEPARDGHLDGSAGANFTLLGQSLMAESPRLAEQLELRLPEHERERGEALLVEGDLSHGHTLIGSAWLRNGDSERAARELQDAIAADGKNFAAYLGLGAALQVGGRDVLRRVDALPDVAELDPMPELAAMVPCFDALTPFEQQVVRVSAHPLRAHLAAAHAAGARVHLLPIDVRPTDLPELAELADDRSDDHRSFAAVGGVATPRAACARVIDLLDIESPSGWVFAHELAHLVFFFMPEPLQDALAELHERGADAGYVFGDYTLQNLDEFFANTYEDYLRQLTGCRKQRELDDLGLVRAVFDFFDGLSDD